MLGPIEEPPKPRACGAPIRGRGVVVDRFRPLAPDENGDFSEPPGRGYSPELLPAPGPRFSPEFGRKSDCKSFDGLNGLPGKEPEP